MVHRSEIDEFGNIHQLPPFYNQNCVVDGESQAAVFMMAGIAIPGQRMQRASMLNPIKNIKEYLMWQEIGIIIFGSNVW